MKFESRSQLGSNLRFQAHRFFKSSRFIFAVLLFIAAIQQKGASAWGADDEGRNSFPHGAEAETSAQFLGKDFSLIPQAQFSGSQFYFKTGDTVSVTGFFQFVPEKGELGKGRDEEGDDARVHDKHARLPKDLLRYSAKRGIFFDFVGPDGVPAHVSLTQSAPDTLYFSTAFPNALASNPNLVIVRAKRLPREALGLLERKRELEKRLSELNRAFAREEADKRPEKKEIAKLEKAISNVEGVLSKLAAKISSKLVTIAEIHLPVFIDNHPAPDGYVMSVQRMYRFEITAVGGGTVVEGMSPTFHAVVTNLRQPEHEDEDEGRGGHHDRDDDRDTLARALERDFSWMGAAVGHFGPETILPGTSAVFDFAPGREHTGAGHLFSMQLSRETVLGDDDEHGDHGKDRDRKEIRKILLGDLSLPLYVVPALPPVWQAGSTPDSSHPCVKVAQPTFVQVLDERGYLDGPTLKAILSGAPFGGQSVILDVTPSLNLNLLGFGDAGIVQGALPPLADGSYTLSRHIANLAAQAATPDPLIASFIVNNQPPTITSSLASYTLTNNPNLNFTVGVEDRCNAANFDVTLDGAAIAATSASFQNVTTVIANDGVHTVVISAVDPAGNTSQVSAVYVLDRVPPKILSISPKPGSTLYTRTIQVLGMADKKLSSVSVNGVSFQISSDGQSFSGAYTFSADGVQPVILVLVDLAGNNTTYSGNVTVNTAPAILSNLSPSDGAPVSGVSTPVSGQSNKPLSRISVNSTPLQLSSDGMSFSGVVPLAQGAPGPVACGSPSKPCGSPTPPPPPPPGPSKSTGMPTSAGSPVQGGGSFASPPLPSGSGIAPVPMSGTSAQPSSVTLTQKAGSGVLPPPPSGGSTSSSATLPPECTQPGFACFPITSPPPSGAATCKPDGNLWLCNMNNPLPPPPGGGSTGGTGSGSFALNWQATDTSGNVTSVVTHVLLQQSGPSKLPPGGGAPAKLASSFLNTASLAFNQSAGGAALVASGSIASLNYSAGNDLTILVGPYSQLVSGSSFTQNSNGVFVYTAANPQAAGIQSLTLNTATNTFSLTYGNAGFTSAAVPFLFQLSTATASECEMARFRQSTSTWSFDSSIDAAYPCVLVNAPAATRYSVFVGDTTPIQFSIVLDSTRTQGVSNLELVSVDQDFNTIGSPLCNVSPVPQKNAQGCSILLSSLSAGTYAIAVTGTAQNGDAVISPTMQFRVFSPLTQDQINQIKSTADQARNIWQQRQAAMGNSNEARQATSLAIQTLPGVQSTEISGDGNIEIHYSVGGTIILNLLPPGSAGNPYVGSNNVYLASAFKLYLSSRSQVFPDPSVTISNFINANYVNSARNCPSLMQPTLIPENELSENFTASGLAAALEHKGIIFINSHGMLHSNQVAIATNEVALIPSTIPGTASLLSWLSDEFVASEVSLPDGAPTSGIYFYWFTPKFIKNHAPSLSQSIVFLAACDSLTNPSMAEAFIDRGARSVIGYNSTIAQAFINDTASTVIMSLLDNRATVQEAIDNLGASNRDTYLLGQYNCPSALRDSKNNCPPAPGGGKVVAYSKGSDTRFSPEIRLSSSSVQFDYNVVKDSITPSPRSTTNPENAAVEAHVCGRSGDSIYINQPSDPWVFVSPAQIVATGSFLDTPAPLIDVSVLRSQIPTNAQRSPATEIRAQVENGAQSDFKIADVTLGITNFTISPQTLDLGSAILYNTNSLSNLGTSMTVQNIGTTSLNVASFESWLILRSNCSSIGCSFGGVPPNTTATFTVVPYGTINLFGLFTFGPASYTGQVLVSPAPINGPTLGLASPTIVPVTLNLGPADCSQFSFTVGGELAVIPSVTDPVTNQVVHQTTITLNQASARALSLTASPQCIRGGYKASNVVWGIINAGQASVILPKDQSFVPNFPGPGQWSIQAGLIADPGSTVGGGPDVTAQITVYVTQ